VSTQPKCSLLVVEDNPADVALLRYALTRSSIPIDVYAVEDGAAALAFLQRQEPYTIAPHPHLLLLDLNLPKKHGHEVLAEIKTHPQLKQLPVIMLSSSANPDDITRSYTLGANAYVIKPLMLDDYVRVVQDFVQFWCQSAELPSSVTPEARSRSGSS
jgi:two-component system response regulator